MIEDPAVSMLLAEDDGELLGFSTSGESRDEDADPAVGEIRSFFVAAGRWRRGVGGAEKTEDAWAHLPEVRLRRSL